MPTETDIMIEMAPQYTLKKLRKRFDLNAFTRGEDFNKGFIYWLHFTAIIVF